MSEEMLQEVAKVFYALSSVARLRILSLLESSRRPLHIKAVSRALKIDYATVYRHIKALESAGLVEIYDVGRSRVVEVKDPNTLKELIAKAGELKQRAAKNE
ncbi:MAG: winged helix-turn-helix transcriptional regulator [Thaumarchaeota archaeon]|jgi:ArsR family transcriptional regulator|nr:winged helix-turn-helix transcriptional regulator [Nitrososphaerota archaeon]